MKILFVIYSAIDTCSFYRSSGIAPDLKDKLNIDIDVMTWNNEFHWANLINYNLIMMQRPCSDMALSMALYSKNLGIPLWVDYDDLLINIPWENKVSEAYPDKVKEIIRKTICIADVISVTTERLRQELVPYSDNIHVIPNAFNDYIFRRREDPVKREKVIAWRGSETHLADLMAVKDPVTRAMEKHLDWAFAFMGMRPLLYGEFKNMLYFQTTDPMIFFRNVGRLAPVLFHVPLNDNIFNRCKSNIAYIEAAFNGCMCIAPDWEEWRMPGISNYTTNDDYFDLIDEIIDDCNKGGSFAKEHALRAWEYIQENLRLSEVNKLRVKLIESLI